MSKRLTDKNHEAVNKCGEYSSCYSCKRDVCYINELADKLAQVEDFMEEEKIEFVADLVDEFKSNKIDKEIYRNKANRVEQEDQALKSRWEKLKEFIKKEIAFDKDEVKDFPLAPNRHYITAESMILDKMQELEKESKDE